jgi:hypothetical protein
VVVRIKQHRAPEAKGVGHGGWGDWNPRALALPWQWGGGHGVGGGSRVWGEAEGQVLRALEAKGSAADAHLHHELKASSPWHAAGKDLAPIVLSHMF